MQLRWSNVTWLVCFGCTEIVLRRGPSGRMTVFCWGGMWKDTTAGFHMSKVFATCWGMLFQMFRLGYLCLGRVHLGFVLGSVVHIWLFWPFRALSLNIFGLLRSISRTVGLVQGYYAPRNVFHLFYWDLLVDPLCFMQTMHFQTLWPFKALCLNLDRLIRPTLVHGSGHGKGRPKLAWAGFQRGRVLNRHGQDASRHRQDVSWRTGED